MSASVPTAPSRPTPRRDERRFCAHCGLPVGTGRHARRIEGETREFCCLGCGIAARLTGPAGDEGGGPAAAFLARLGLGLVLSMIVMLISWVPYLEPSAATSESYRHFAPWATLLAATPVVLLLGIPYLWNAAAGLRHGRIGSDVLIGLGIFAAYGASLVGFVSGHADSLYLDTATGLATLVTLGRWLEAQAKERSVRGLRSFLSADERPALRLVSGATLAMPGDVATVRSSDLRLGDHVLVRPGARVPADGVVVEGRAYVDEAALTGEPLPRAVAPGDAVAAPVIATDGALVVRVTALGADTRLGAVADVLARARSERSPLERLAERLSSIFVPLVLAIAAFVFLRDRMSGESFAAASLRALAVLVVACPCALAIATPLAITTAMGRLAERGILVRTGEALGGLPRVRVVAFDKTGTLTEGRPRVQSLEAFGSDDEAHVLALAAAVEASSEHGLARAIGNAAKERGLAALAATDVVVTPGLGVEGVVEGTRVRVGRRSFVASPPADRSIGDDGAPGGRTTEAFVSLDGRIALRLSFADSLRPSAPAAIAALAADGIECHLISGDGVAPTEDAARSLGVPRDRAHGGCLPAAKVDEVRRLRTTLRGPVAFVGDGLNDAPALAAADLSVAVGSGTDLARETADVSLLGDDLGRLPGLFRAARRTRRAVRWNLFWAFVYNVVGVGFAAFGRLPPLFAALAMVVSSLFVVANSVRLRSALGRDLAGTSRGAL